MSKSVVPKLYRIASYTWMPKVRQIRFAYLREGHCIQISFVSSYGNHMAVGTSHNTFTWSRTFNPLDKNFLIESKLDCNFGMWSTSVMRLIVVHWENSTPTMMDPIPMASATLSSPNVHCAEKWCRRCRMLSYAKSCALWLLNPWSICECTSNALHVALQMRTRPRPSYYWRSPSFCSLLCSKIAWCDLICRNGNTSSHIAAKLDRPLCFDATPSPRRRLGAPSPYVFRSHVSNVSLRTPSSIPSSALSPKRWSSIRTGRTHS